MPTRTHCTIAIAAMAISALAMTATAAPERSFDDVAKGFTKVETTTDGSFYDVWYDKKSEELLAELPRGFERQKHYIAVTPSAGGAFAGLQGPDFYVYWKRFDDRLALITPELQTRSTGEAESRDSVERLFTDRVLFDVPIVTTGPSGQPVIDLDAMLLGEIAPMASRGRGFGRGGGGRLNTRLAEIATCKTFPKNLELDVRGEASHESQEQSLDATRARVELGWSSRFCLEEGLDRTIDWYTDYLKNGSQP